MQLLGDRHSLGVHSSCCLPLQDAAGITEENTKYDELLVAKQGSDSYVSQSVQTLPSFPKNKEVLVQPPATAESVRHRRRRCSRWVF